MTKSRTLLLPLALGGTLLVLAALASLMWFRSTRPAEGEQRVVAVPAPAAARAHVSESTAVLETPRAESDDASDAALPANSASSTESRDAAEVVTGREIDGAIWIRGRVVLPPGTALDESMEVVATGRKWRDSAEHRARVEPDGTFLSAFAKETRKGKLKLDAPHLYLEEPLEVDLREPPAIVELTPKLGALVRGRLIARPGSEALSAELAGQKVKWSPGPWERGGESTITPDLQFEFRGLPPNQQLALSLDARAVEPLDQALPPLPPGADHQVELTFRGGVRMRGRVVDEAGAPVRNVIVGVGSEEQGWSRRVTSTDEAGAFDLRGITPGNVLATAIALGYERATLDLGELADGDLREQVVLVMKRGNSVSGTVRWPDGTPAEGAIVRAIATDSADPFMGAPNNARSGADGTFVLGNLPEGTLTVRAQLRTRSPKATTNSTEAKTSPEKELTRPMMVHARADGVRAGGVVDLVLRAGASVSGRVLDDLGKPVTRFRVRVSRDEESVPLHPQEARMRNFRDEEGRFTLDGLSEGRWRIQISAPRHRESSPLPFEVGGDVTLADVTLIRAGVVTGTVVGSDGAPLSYVPVRVLRPQSAESRTFTVFGNDSGPASDAESTTDSQGRFTLEVQPGVPVQLVASDEQHSPSAPHEVAVAAGQELTGIVLKLGAPGAIVGRFIARRSESPAGRQVTALLLSGNAYEQHETRTDASGGFRFGFVPAGTYRVWVNPPGPEPPREQGSDRERWNIARESAEVVVADGATSELVIGRVARAPVAVSGRVSRAGRGLADVDLQANRAGDDGRPALARTDGTGRYALELDEPGTYSFSLDCPNGTQLSQVVVIPEGATHSVDFELASGRIRGRVVSATGKPLADIEVRLVVERVKSSEGVVPWTGSCSTDAEGRFAFDGLPAGTFGLWSAGTQMLASARVSGLVIDGVNAIDGVELRQEVAGAIEARVLDSDGVPTEDADLVLRDTQGALSYLRVWHDGEHYNITGLAPGRYTFSATRGAEVAAKPVMVEIVPGCTAKAELQLVRGTVLEIIARNAAGELVASSFSVRDSSGADFSELHPSDDSASNEVGPLARGTYTVVVEAGGKRTGRSIAVTGQEWMVVELRYEP